jgi:hypothetical protein
VQHAVPQSLVDMQLRQFHDGQPQQPIYCPLGHQWTRAGKTDSQRLREDLAAKDRTIAAVRAQHDQTRAELRETENRRRAEKAAKTKLKRRVANGVCPCCKRHFDNLQRHIHSQHPEFVSEVKADEVTA